VEKGDVDKAQRGLRGAGLYLALPIVNVSLANCDPHSFPVDVSPFETENFAYPQSQTHRHDEHGPKRFGNVLQESAEFLRCQELWFDRHRSRAKGLV
jgi:hypothetical protein